MASDKCQLSTDKLTLISYNCEYADSARLSFLQKLFLQCDFLMLQEHGLYKTQFDWFYSIGDNVSSHCVSAMDERQMLTGRPHGGVAIVWRSTINAKVIPVHFESSRTCAVTIECDNFKVLLVCVYMPCDDNRPNSNIIEYKSVLSDIQSICNIANDTQHVIIGGDLNTDFSRNSYCTGALNGFLDDEDLYCLSKNNDCNFDFTYQSKGSGVRSFIDHFIVSQTLNMQTLNYNTVDGADNFSDHLAIKCTLKFDVEYCVPAKPKSGYNTYMLNWNRATAHQIEKYGNELDGLLHELSLPMEAIACEDKFCDVHVADLCKLHDDIIDCLIKSSKNCIPTINNNSKQKTIPGWNDYVKKYFESSLFWHNMWVQNGRPQQGIIAELRKSTRSKYHSAYKMVQKKEAEIRCDKMAEAIAAKSTAKMYRYARSFKRKKTSCPGKVDNIFGEENIANHFASKFCELYNSVSFDTSEMSNLKIEIDDLLTTRCSAGGGCVHNNHDFSCDDVVKGIKCLKQDKKDGNIDLVTNHIIHGCHRLNVLLALLFSAIVKHGVTPSDMLSGTMVPIPKGRWANLTMSENFRAITLGSILGKLLDTMILSKERDRLVTSDLQFGYKSGSSTTLCTSMVMETVSYFVSNGSNVYGLMLDASKAFDRVSYCKLFRLLIDRGICPVYCRFLLNMYINQKLRVRWQNCHSAKFRVSNGVKQGGVISPILFCLYIDGLLNELKDSNVGCHMGDVYAGAFGYADDIKLLAPSVAALKSMITICENYARRFNILFNGKKSELIIYKCRKKVPPDPVIFVNNIRVPRKSKVTYLGHDLYEDIFSFNVDKCVSDFNRQCNIFFADFKNANSVIRNELFNKYCTSFYGSQLYPLYNDSMQAIYCAWRVAVRKVWRVPNITHCSLLPYLAGCMDIKLWFAKRCINFIKNTCKSDNLVVKTIVNMGLNGSHSVIGGNKRYLENNFSFCVNNVNKSWSDIYSENLARTAEHIKEVISVRDRCAVDNVLSYQECKDIIAFLCTM